MFGYLDRLFAGHGGHGGGPHSGSTPANVPEIDAASGVLALAAILATLALAWELKRRRAQRST